MAEIKANKVSKAASKQYSGSSLPFVAAADEVVDPALASLFKAKFTPVRSLDLRIAALDTRSKVHPDTTHFGTNGDQHNDSTQLEDHAQQIPGSGSNINQTREATITDSEDAKPELESQDHLRKRKRRLVDEDEDLESKYMRRQEMDEVKEGKRRQLERTRQQRISPATAVGVNVNLQSLNGSPDSDDGNEGDEGSTESNLRDNGSNDEYSESNRFSSSQQNGIEDSTLQHESLTPSSESIELEKSSRTVFFANVSTLAITSKSAKKALIKHLTSFIPSLPADTIGHKLESFRFRSVAFISSTVPKRAAFAKKELMDATTRTTNAYGVYSTTLAAREAVKRLNGTVVLERHIRVDSVAHPAKVDHKRCVFVGNLGFVDDESLINASEDIDGRRRPRKAKEPSDIEEGLWRQFEKAGKVESVRVIRDQQTRVGKGIAYVQFMDPNGVEAALLFNEKRYPPLLLRKLRVTRAKNIKKPSTISNAYKTKNSCPNTDSSQVYSPKVSSQIRSLQGRASKLLGRAGGAQFKALGNTKAGNERDPRYVVKTPETVVFEGYRANSRNGKENVRMGGSGKRKGKPRSRSSKRGAAWKKFGGKKGA